MLELIIKMLERSDLKNTVLPPTHLYNEGWMLRLVLDWFHRTQYQGYPLSFTPQAHWFSEALLPTHFPRKKRGDAKGEAYTHADGIVGHFKINAVDRGDTTLYKNAKQFVVIEAKLGSKLSADTRNAPSYDQAARTVACMAEMIAEEKIHPDTFDRLAFYVIAPELQISAGVFMNLVSRESIEQKVKARVDAYQDITDHWFERYFLPTFYHMKVDILSWETALTWMGNTVEVDQIKVFYEMCKQYNLPSIVTEAQPDV